MARVVVDKSVPGEKSVCDGCEFYKHIRDMEGQEKHYCAAPRRTGDVVPPIRMAYKASECDFFSKNKEGENFVIPDEHTAYRYAVVDDPKDPNGAIGMMLSPGEYNAHMDPYGMGLPPEAYVNRGVITMEEWRELEEERVKEGELRRQRYNEVQAAKSLTWWQRFKHWYEVGLGIYQRRVLRGEEEE